MRILAADIGGTHSRFAAVDIEDPSNITMKEPFIFPTGLKSIGSLKGLLAHFKQNAPSEMADLDQYRALALGVAGAIDGKQAILPNISWNIDTASVVGIDHIYLLNDFYAQAHAFLNKHLLDSLYEVRPGGPMESKLESKLESKPGTIAVVGAGTGLGHAAVKPSATGSIVLASESGHATLSFHGQEERAVERFFLARTGRNWISNDDVVSGPGAALLHECLTGKKVTPARALSATNGNSETCALFSRFYARACRNYCLAMHPVGRLVISGGIAAKNPHLVECTEFSNEFNDAGHYRHLFECISIYLNTDQGLGIKGAAIHAWLQTSNKLESP